MTHNSEEFEQLQADSQMRAVINGQLLVAGGNGFDLTHPDLPEALKKQGDIILAAHLAAIRASNKALLEEIKSAFPYEAYINNIDGKWLLEVLDAKLAAIEKEGK